MIDLDKLKFNLDPRNVFDWVTKNELPPQVNTCASCTACCTWPAITDQPDMPDKAAGKTCEHCTAKGCGIYDKRPSLCSGYLCMFTLGVTDKRPSECGVAWSFQPDLTPGAKRGGVIAMGHCPDWQDALERNEQDIIDMLNSGMITAILLRDTKHAVRLDPKEGCRMCDVHASDPLRYELDPSTERAAPIQLSSN
jgi:hypothetical protein